MSKLEIERRRNQTLELWLLGKSQAQIAEELKVSDDTVLRDMKALKGEINAELQRRRAALIKAVVDQIAPPRTGILGSLLDITEPAPQVVRLPPRRGTPRQQPNYVGMDYGLVGPVVVSMHRLPRES